MFKSATRFLLENFTSPINLIEMFIQKKGRRSRFLYRNASIVNYQNKSQGQQNKSQGQQNKSQGQQN